LADRTNDLDLRQGLVGLTRHRRELSILVLAAVVLAVAEYLLIPIRFPALFPEILERTAPGVWYGAASHALAAGLDGTWWGPLAPFAWWSLGLVVAWILVPLAWARYLGFAPRDLGWRWGGLDSKLWLYGALFVPVGLAVTWAATRPSFLATYPMLRPDQIVHWSWSVLILYWLLYGLQFVCVEAFFRGYLLFPLERTLGTASIGVMVVPYCMIHFHKPLPEVFGAIVAGLVLGWLALVTRSIWGGVLLHVAVALSMDVAALARSPLGFPTTWLP
jgi:membrane protease YdiL (CAAX protease family)